MALNCHEARLVFLLGHFDRILVRLLRPPLPLPVPDNHRRDESRSQYAHEAHERQSVFAQGIFRILVIRFRAPCRVQLYDPARTAPRSRRERTPRPEEFEIQCGYVRGEEGPVLHPGLHPRDDGLDHAVLVGACVGDRELAADGGAGFVWVCASIDVHKVQRLVRQPKQSRSGERIVAIGALKNILRHWFAIRHGSIVVIRIIIGIFNILSTVFVSSLQLPGRDASRVLSPSLRSLQSPPPVLLNHQPQTLVLLVVRTAPQHAIICEDAPPQLRCHDPLQLHQRGALRIFFFLLLVVVIASEEAGDLVRPRGGAPPSLAPLDVLPGNAVGVSNLVVEEEADLVHPYLDVHCLGLVRFGVDVG
mmetsp:Transcript_30316/g.73201  ORF Transcript_30316/g.73201 Transcript_30316/m.73201 type:complete len:362 (-) Transcript_30316:336-1421(-)